MKFIRNLKGTTVPGLVILAGQVTTTTSGTIGSSECYGFTIAKTGSETGRYTITLERATQKLVYGHAVLTVADDAALTTTKGLSVVLRDNDLATDGTIEVQFVQTNSGNADTEVQDSAVINILLVVCDTGAR